MMTDAERREISNQPPASEILPLIFKTGTRINSMAIACGNCGKDVPSTQIHGNMSRINEHCATFSGHGLCYQCRTVTPIDCRFSDDGSMLIKDGSGWQRSMITREKTGMVVMVRNWLKTLAKYMRG
jgi:hypothetical protein